MVLYQIHILKQETFELDTDKVQRLTKLVLNLKRTRS